MLVTPEKAKALVESGKLLHISGAESLLKELPRGNWIGGSTEYFLGEGGGSVTDALISVVELPFDRFKIVSYDADSIAGIVGDTYDNGFTLAIVPFDSPVHRKYALESAQWEGLYLSAILGWVAGYHLSSTRQTAVTVNGYTGAVSETGAAALHVELPQGKTAQIDIINIFEPDRERPSVFFAEDTLEVKDCAIGGKVVNFARHLRENQVNTKLPLVGDYSGAYVNVSFKEIVGDTVYLYAPVAAGIEYHLARGVDDYESAFREKLDLIEDSSDYVFACNCILNFLYGGLEGKDLGSLYGPVTFGEIAWQVINQTLVYLRVR
ncbi:MAG: hypothetical protein LBS85_06980 [Clostridiales Family XIII bacterium]|jgi:hypothetical protein|nr:hypothetical protein [Clostridiales Family XIII bacterium]